MADDSVTPVSDEEVDGYSDDVLTDDKDLNLDFLDEKDDDEMDIQE